jgi:PAS domain S-box-containing protein
MRDKWYVIFAAVACLTAGWGILFAGRILGIGFFQSVPTWVAGVLLLASVALSFLSGRSARTRWGVALAAALAAAALASVGVSKRDTTALESSWWSGESSALANTLLAVGQDISRLEDLSSTAGRHVAQWYEQGGFDSDGRPMRSRFEAFEMLDSLATAISGSGELTRGTEIGLQVFDAGGRRIAWGGWPQPIERIDRDYLDSGVELVYSCEVSLYRILRHIVPVKAANGRGGVRVLVDLPLEVNYRVNNRFLMSTALADRFASEQVPNLRFDYSPNLSNLPQRLDRYKVVQEQNMARRERLIRQRQERERNDRRSVPGSGRAADTDTAAGAGGQAAQETPRARPRRALNDSVLTYFPFPAFMEPTTEISGDRVTGLQAGVLIRSDLGNPIVIVTAIGEPFRHFAERYQARWIEWARSFVVLALLVMFVVAMLALGRQGYHAWLRGAAFVGFLVLLRYSMLSLGSFSIGGDQKIFDPTVFANPMLGGIMRSAGDLLITGLFFVVAVYGMMKMIRGRGDSGGVVRAAAAATDRGGASRAVRVVVEAVVMAVVLYCVYRLARGFSGTMVLNANPRLIGETMRLTDISVLVLHLGVFLTLTGIILSGMLVVWGMFRLTGWHDAVKASWAAFGLLAAAAVLSGPLELAWISGLLLLFVVLAPRYVQREDIVSIAIVSFCLVVITSGLTYVFFARDYDGLRKVFIKEQASDLIEPRDDWKRLILEDILGEYTRMPRIRRALRTPDSPESQRLAFDLWADALLSRLGTSCSIYVLTDKDEVVSDFSVDMPYRLRIDEEDEPLEAPVENDWVVLDISRSTPQGIVRSYRGIVYVQDQNRVSSESPTGQVLGKIVVDLPYFFESLAWASRTGPRTPEVLRNVQEGGVASRREEPEALLLARLSGTRVYESSSENLPVGRTIPKALFERGLEGKWPLLSTSGGGYRFFIKETSEPDTFLLAGFAIPSPLRHLIRWSTLFSLYLLYTALIIVAIIALGAIPYLEELLPTLTPGRKFGFQQKLLASFLVMALVPAVLLGLFSVDFIEKRFVEENRVEAVDKLFSARRALVNLLHGEMGVFLGHVDLDRLLTEEGYAEGAATGPRLVRVFNEAGLPGPIRVDEGGRRVGGGDPQERGVDLTDASTEDLYILQEGKTSYIGVVGPAQPVIGDVWRDALRVYFARRLDTTLLGDIADQINADVNVYGSSGELTASSQEGLLSGGLISAIISGDAYVKVSMYGSEHLLATERAGQYRYQVAYLPVTSWSKVGDSEGDSEVTTPPAPGGRHNHAGDAVLSVPLLFLPESYSLEIQKATSIVLGIFALLFVATIGLGLLLARGMFEPLRSLLEGTRRISRGDLDVKLPLRRFDEIGTVVSAFNEMTAQLSESRRALDERRRYLETILASIGTGVISTGADDRIRTVNGAAQRILGIEPDVAIGRTPAEMVEASLAPEIFKLLRDGRDAVEAFIASEVELQRDGKRSTIKYMVTKLDVEGRYLGTVFVFEDLTELIQTKKLSAWVEMARQIAHEIKNPLTPIRISTQFMRRAYEQKSDKFEQIFIESSDTIIQQVDVLKRIASEFSSYGRMQQLDVSARELAPMLDNIVQPYLRNSAGVVVEVDNGVPDAEVLMDAEAVRKICTNLIENAMDAMPDGGRLAVSCRKETFDGTDFIRVSFRDTGPGLSEAAEEKLFEPYFSTKTTGTGLGLAICRSLSQEMGGDIDVHNVPEGGVEASLLLRAAS